MKEKRDKNTNIKNYISLAFGLFIVLGMISFMILGGNAWFYDINLSSTRVELHRVFSSAFYIIYYTSQSNLFLGLMFIVNYFKKTPLTNSLFFASVALITITFIIYWTAVAPFNSVEIWNNIYLNFDSIITHVINPMLGFFYLIWVRKEFVINKKIIGICAMYLGVFLISSDILYGASAYYDPNSKHANHINGAAVYTFIDVQNFFFMNLQNLPWVAWLMNIILIIACPFIVIALSFVWIKLTKIQTQQNSYYSWMDKLKDKYIVKK